MNKLTQRLIEQVNQKLNHKKYFYFSKEAERGIGLENLTQNYKVICSNLDGVATQINARVVSPKNSSELFDLDFINLQTNNEHFFAETFYHSSTLQYKIKSQNGTLLNPDSSVSKFFESKLNLNLLLDKLDITHPKSRNLQLLPENLKGLDFPIVIQLDKSHTGTGTFIVKERSELEFIVNKYKATECKISEYIDGIPVTLNGCITQKDIFINGLQYQITGMLPMTNSLSTTVGNDFTLGSTYLEKYGEKFRQIMRKLGDEMRKQGFFGLFGIDAIIRESEVYVIEINARQTANIPLQTQLELLHDQVPLKLIHIAHFFGIDTSDIKVELNPLDGAQIFLRSRSDEFKINIGYQSGIYRLQGDNSAIKWENGVPTSQKPNTIFLDESKDKSLIFQKEAYRLDQIDNGGFLMLTQNKLNIRAKSEEILRFQFKEGIVKNGKIEAWILESLNSIYNSLL